MTKYIATRLHKALELAPDDPFLEDIKDLPHYVIDPSLADLLLRGDVAASINAVIEAGLDHLPFTRMLIELETETTPSVRCFIELTEGMGGGFTARMGVLRADNAFEVDPARMTLTLGDAGVTVDEPTKRSHPTWMKMAGVTLCIAMLMLNIQGVEKETIEAAKLNRGRIASGKPAVPRHTVMRIAHVYRADGSRESYTAGRHMAVHLRAGHARHQHYGPDNSLVKLIYIPPVIVNFKPGGEAPRAPKRILAA